MNSDRVVVVTGGNRGLGHEVVRQCAARGDTVLLGARDPAAGERIDGHVTLPAWYRVVFAKADNG